MNPIESEILKILQNKELGLSRAELQAQLAGDAISIQQLQRALRALRALEQKGAIRFEGNTRARRYWLKDARAKAATPTIPLSAEALEAVALVSRPLHARAPSSYRRAFLDDTCRKSRHLPTKVRAHFVAMAELEVEGLHEGTYARYGLRPSEFAAWTAQR
jgi:hypothetical protein